jgi:hypothetical protein
MKSILEKHKETWEKKKILRVIYTAWYNKIINDLSSVKGDTVELRAGSGNFKEFKPDVILSDIDEYEWLDMCFDAHNMPFDANTCYDRCFTSSIKSSKIFRRVCKSLEKRRASYYVRAISLFFFPAYLS